MKVLKVAGCMVVILAIVFATVPVFGQTYHQGYEDGRRDGANDAGYITGLWGFLFGVFNVGYVLLTQPQDCPPARVLLLEGKSLEYKQGYLDGYKKGRQGQRLLYSVVGAVTGYIVMFLAAQT